MLLFYLPDFYRHRKFGSKAVKNIPLFDASKISKTTHAAIPYIGSADLQPRRIRISQVAIFIDS
jgi:hypothetical protein